MRPRQQQGLLLQEPQFRRLILTFRTITVLARMVTVQGLIAIFTREDVSTQGFSSTLFDGQHRLVVTDWHALAKFLSILGPIATKDIGDLHHVSFSTSRLMLSVAFASVWAVRWVYKAVVARELCPK
jgi:hypothetical protein